MISLLLLASKIFNSLHSLTLQDPADQQTIDKVMLDLDGTENKTNLGANAILGAEVNTNWMLASHADGAACRRRNLLDVSRSCWTFYGRCFDGMLQSWSCTERHFFVQAAHGGELRHFFKWRHCSSVHVGFLKT